MSNKGKKVAVLNRQDLTAFFTSLSKRFRIFGPSRINRVDSLVEIASADAINFNYRNMKMSPKAFFFPQTQTLFSFDNESKDVNTSEPCQDRQRILFGLRPCDAQSIWLLDKVFVENTPSDPYYMKLRTSTRIVSLACTHPSPTCFCTSVNCGPDSEIGADVIFYELNGCYLIKTLTPEGEDVVAVANDIVKPPTEKELSEKEDIMRKAREKMKRVFDLECAQKTLDNFDAPRWARLYQKCLGCGVCTYLCPTCHCFDITDEVVQPRGRRVRTWDSCMYQLFTLHASGHNPRPTQKERMRQRIMHKFSYARKYYGHAFCVGCGRCITYCPVNVDIRQFMKKFMEEK